MQKREIRVMIKSTKTNQRRISLMDYCIRKLLRLADKNFIPDKIWLETIVENNETENKIRITPVLLRFCVSFTSCQSET